MEGASIQAYRKPEERFDRAQKPLAGEVSSQFTATAELNATFDGRTERMHLQNVVAKKPLDLALSKLIMLLRAGHSRELLPLAEEAGAG